MTMEPELYKHGMKCTMRMRDRVEKSRVEKGRGVSREKRYIMGTQNDASYNASPKFVMKSHNHHVQTSTDLNSSRGTRPE